MRDKKITIDQQLHSCVIWKVNDTWKMPIFFLKNEMKQSRADGEIINDIQNVQPPTSSAGIHNLKHGKTYGIGLHNSYNKLNKQIQ
jgi:hypothetical protein